MCRDVWKYHGKDLEVKTDEGKEKYIPITHKVTPNQASFSRSPSPLDNDRLTLLMPV